MEYQVDQFRSQFLFYLLRNMVGCIAMHSILTFYKYCNQLSSYIYGKQDPNCDNSISNITPLVIYCLRLNHSNYKHTGTNRQYGNFAECSSNVRYQHSSWSSTKGKSLSLFSARSCSSNWNNSSMV